MYNLLKYLKPYKKECIIGPAFKLLEAIFELLLPTMMAFIINNGIAKGDTNYVIKIGSFMVIMSVLGFSSSLLCQYYAARTSQGFGTNLRNALFMKISSFSYSDLESFGTATLINRITNDVNQLQVAVAMLIRLVIRAPFICIGAVVMAMLLDIHMSLILIISIPIFILILYVIINFTSPLYTLYQEKLDRLTSSLRENLLGVRIIRAFAKGNYERLRFGNRNDDLTKTALRIGKISSLLNPLTTLIMNAAIIAILWAGGIQIHSGMFSSGVLLAMINYITQILLALIVVSNLIIIFTRANASAQRVNEILKTNPSIPSDIDRDISTSNTHISSNIEACINNDLKDNPLISTPLLRFNNVSFCYSKTRNPVLSNISININHGETVGIIGGTGAGKSTLINLIPRFYDIENGEIILEGKNIKDYNLQELRRKIGFVHQKPILFKGTILENLTIGNPNASFEEIQKSAWIAQANDFIENLQDGYESKVERGGVNFSGGQRQRLTIARALINQPQILILDDATSALDYSTDLALRNALLETKASTTLIIVSQRVSTIMNATKIIVLEDGHIIGYGNHKELLETCQIYNEIYLSQTENEEAVS